MLHLGWDEPDYAWQRTEVISHLHDKKYQMDWHGLIGMTKERLQQATTHFAPD